MIASSHRATALAIAALAVPVLAAGATEARTVKPYYSETYETKGPARGYEGFLFPDYYCSYKRYPNRACSTDAQRSRPIPVSMFLLGSGSRLLGGAPTRLNCVNTRFQISTGLPMPVST